MGNTIQAVKGMNDALPTQTIYWCYLEEVLRQIANSYSYSEIRLPILEETNLFKRTIGEVTDIVEKEMYTFEDRNGKSVSLRPEGTAGCVRAGIEHGIFYNQVQRLWYTGPMFRYERPQQGRFRQFYQFGAEAFGMQGPNIDAEQILMVARIWEALGIRDQITLHINSLGSGVSREKYREKLIAFFEENRDILDEDSERRLYTNPMRILDSKNPNMQLMLSAAPRIIDYLDDESRLHFEKLTHYLNDNNIPFVINSKIVRGLDYYNRTVYEWITDSLGAQGTVCAGGRYDVLVEHLGGKPTPAVGFAMGLDRVVTLLESVYSPDGSPHVYVVMAGDEAISQAMQLSEKIRQHYPEFRVLCDYSGGNFKAQIKRADKSGAKIALILGENEVATNSVTIKYLREERPQRTLPVDEMLENLFQGLLE